MAQTVGPGLFGSLCLHKHSAVVKFLPDTLQCSVPSPQVGKPPGKWVVRVTERPTHGPEPEEWAAAQGSTLHRDSATSTLPTVSQELGRTAGC